MNAREKISTALQASQFTADQAEFLSRELYDFVAHELAEKIREQGGWHGARSESLRGMAQAADLIDPEVDQ